MAIDLNKPLGAPPAGSTALPTKKTINLLVHENKTRNLWKYALAALVLLGLLALFAKFAVFDVLQQVDIKKTELHAAQQERDAVTAQLENYDAVLEEYRSYTGIATQGSIDALRVFDLVANVIQPKATVTGASTSDDVLVVNVTDITLDDLGKLADELSGNSLVKSVSVTTAVEKSSEGEDAKNVSATLQIALVNLEEAGEE